MEAMWETEPAPASFNVFAIPDQKNMKNDFVIRIPYVLGFIATRSYDTPIPGIREIVRTNEGRIRKGILAVEALDRMRAHPDDLEARQQFEENQKDLGFGLLLRNMRGIRQSDSRGDSPRRPGDYSAGDTAVLVFQGHGRSRFCLFRSFCTRVLLFEPQFLPQKPGF